MNVPVFIYNLFNYYIGLFNFTLITGGNPTQLASYLFIYCFYFCSVKISLSPILLHGLCASEVGKSSGKMLTYSLYKVYTKADLQNYLRMFSFNIFTHFIDDYSQIL